MSEAADKAWQEYAKALDPVTRDHVVAKNAFLAGWKARKPQYSIMIGERGRKDGLVEAAETQIGMKR